MKTIWFKAQYTARILEGKTTDTIRRRSNRRYQIGETVALAIGPRPPFAIARITGIESVALTEIDPSRHQAVKDLCGQTDLLRIRFVLVEKKNNEGQTFNFASN